MMEVIVIGGSAAGLKAACHIARRKPDARVRVLVQSPHFAYSTCGLPYLLSGDLDDYSALISTSDGTLKDLAYFRDVKRVGVLPLHRAEWIDLANRSVSCSDQNGGRSKSFSYDKLLVATGSLPLPLDIAGSDTTGVVTISGPDEIIQLRHDLEGGKIQRVAIIGAGVVGLELCESFRALWGVEVELFELSRHVLAGLLDDDLASLVESELVLHGVHLHLGCRCSEIALIEGGLLLKDDRGRSFLVDRVINATGVKPNTSLAQEAGLEIGLSGGIKADDHLRTSDPDVYAAGDCVELTCAVSGQLRCWSLGSLATRMGRAAGENITGGDAVFGAVAGATVIKVFDLTVGAVGLTAHDCQRRNWGVECSWLTSYDHLHFYPVAQHNFFQLVYSHHNGRVLGFQTVGRGEILHILDKASLVIHSGSSLADLLDIEHAYSPPYSQTVDPLATLACLVENSREGGLRVVSPGGLDDLAEDAILMDVRSEDESLANPLINLRAVISIPLPELRTSLDAIPRGRTVIAVCQMGSRAYEAALILRQAGFADVGFLAGGMLFQPRRLTDSAADAAKRSA